MTDDPCTAELPRFTSDATDFEASTLLGRGQDVIMDRALAFHTAARRYLADRFQELRAIGSALPDGGRVPDGEGWSPDAQRLIPRYDVLQEARLVLEGFDADNLPSLARLVDEATVDLLTVPISRSHVGEDDAAVVDDERGVVAAAWRDLVSSDLTSVEPLPYRRLLSEKESSDWLAHLTDRWPIVGKSWWDPITPEDEAGLSYDTLVLQEDSFYKDRRTGEPGDATLAIRGALLDMGVNRVIELREWGPEYEVAVEDFWPTYTGAEGLFTSEANDWLIFASHEAATALGGSVIAVLKRIWPEWANARWEGWNFEAPG